MFLKKYHKPKLTINLVTTEESLANGSSISFIGATDNLRPEIQDLEKEETNHNHFDINF